MILVPRSEPHVLRVGIVDGSVDPENVSLTLRIGGGRKTTASMNRFGPGDYRFDLPPLQSPVRLELTGGDDQPDPVTIEPVDRPRIVRFELASRHPTQPKAEVHAFSVVWGAHDPFLSRHVGEQLAAAIPGSALTIVPEARHFVPLDKPHAVAGAVATLLAR